MPAPKPFDRSTLQQAFERLGQMARAENKVVEVSIYGGSALVLTTDFRVATRDVDAVFEADRAFVRRAAIQIAAEFGWNDHWINDGVKGFLSLNDADSKFLLHTYPSEDGPGLRVFVASAAYLFAMKCLAMRAGGVEQVQDVDDILNLASTLNIESLAQAIAVVSQYYPAEALPPKTRFGLEEIFGASSV